MSMTDYPDRFTEGLRLYPSPPVAEMSSLTIEKIDFKPKGLILKFAESNTREEAERLSGRDVVIPVDEAVELEEGAFWVYDIIGMRVYTEAGEYVGDVIDVLRTGSNDVYVIQSEDQEYLIPATKEVVKEISTKDRRITIEPIPGLLE
jgi:16S rRNA processing protein RimM